jgi:hypothetical protein
MDTPWRMSFLYLKLVAAWAEGESRAPRDPEVRGSGHDGVVCGWGKSHDARSPRPKGGGHGDSG